MYKKKKQKTGHKVVCKLREMIGEAEFAKGSKEAYEDDVVAKGDSIIGILESKAIQ
jgi:hypothetical protein